MLDTCTYGPDRLELIIFYITEKKIYNRPSHLLIINLGFKPVIDITG